MKSARTWRMVVDEEGRFILPSEVMSGYGLAPGTSVVIEEGANGLHLHRPVMQLAKVYVEATTRCNLACRICVRNVWDELIGDMTDATFARIIEGLRAFSPPPTVFFGGVGEPLLHPQIVEMVAQAKALGASVELITNGMLLGEEISRRLIEAGLDVLWVSLDGAEQERYADIRPGAGLSGVVANISQFRAFRDNSMGHFTLPSARPPIKTQIGIVFVAMKRNIADLPAVLRLGKRLGASLFLVTNVLPYTVEMCSEVLYTWALNSVRHRVPSLASPHLDLPMIDLNEGTHEPLYRSMMSYRNMTISGSHVADNKDRCPFIEEGTAAIRWDGWLSPCLPLLHNNVSFLNESERFSRFYGIGNVNERDLKELWAVPEYVAFRERVQVFDFAPCASCGGCDLSKTNETDCIDTPFPSCGGCLWAQGVIRCP